MQNNPVVTPEMMRAGNIAYSKGESVEAIYLAMAQASPPPDEMVERGAVALFQSLHPKGDWAKYANQRRYTNAACAALQSIGPLMREDAVAELKRLVAKWDDTEEFDTTDLYLFAAAIVGAARAALKRIEGHG